MRSGLHQRSGQDWSESHSNKRDRAVIAARRAFGTEAYRKAWGAAGICDAESIGGAWEDIPFVSKEDMIEAVREAPPFGERIAVGPDELAHVFVAPGPLYMPFTAPDLDHLAHSFASALLSCGLQKSDIVDQTTMYNWVIAATALDKALKLVGCTSVPGGIGQTDRHIDVICDLGINALVAFPTFLEHLLDRARELGRTLPLRKAAVMGELSHPAAKARILREHGVEAREFYGTADVGAVAWECSENQGMHLRDDILVEFIDPITGKLTDPEPGRPVEIVVTDFYREAMPIIRLRTGDLIDGLDTGLCACGNPAPRFRRIAGRSSEITKVKGMFVVPRLVQDVFQAQEINRDFRLHVRRTDGQQDTVALVIAGSPMADVTALKAGVENALRLKVDIEFTETLPEQGPRLLDERSIGSVV